MGGVCWGGPATAWRCVRLFQVLFPFKDFNLEMSKQSPGDYAQINSLPLSKQGSWFQAFPSEESLFDEDGKDGKLGRC